MDVKVENLNKKYADKTVFDNFNIKFPSGKISVVMGKSGEGKSTLLNCIAGVCDYGGNVTGAEKTAYVFQDDRLIPFATVYDNLDITLSKSLAKGERKEKITEILRAVSLEEKIAALPNELSGGQKKRVSIARAFLSDADVLLMDEPLNSLDLGLRMRTVKLLLGMVEKYPRTVIYVTHDIDEALSVANEIFAVDKNGVVYDFEFSSSAIVRDLLGDECNAVKRELIKLLV